MDNEKIVTALAFALFAGFAAFLLGALIGWAIYEWILLMMGVVL